MKNNTLSPHLKSTFSFAVLVLPRRHKTDAGAAEEEDYASHCVGRDWEHLTSLLGGNLTDKQMDSCCALVPCCLYWNGNATVVLPAETGAWVTAGFHLAPLLAHQHEHLQRAKFPSASISAPGCSSNLPFLP